MRIDEYSTEIIDAGRKIKLTTQSQYDRNNLAKKSKEERTIGYPVSQKVNSAANEGLVGKYALIVQPKKLLGLSDA